MFANRLTALLLFVATLVVAFVVSPGFVFGKYVHLAALLANGTLSAAQAGDASPLYLLIVRCLGPVATHVVQVVVAAASVAALFLSQRQRAGFVIALVTALLLGASRSWLTYAAVLEPDLLLGSLLLFAVLAFESKREPVAGALIGLSIALRPTAVLLAMVLLVLAFRRARWRGLLIGMVISAALPALILRVIASQDLRTTMSVGQVFHQSHRPETTGYGATFPSLLKLVEAEDAATSGDQHPDFAHQLYREMARAENPALTSDAATETLWISKSFAFITAAPGAALMQLVRKAVFVVVPVDGQTDIPAVATLRTAGLIPLRWLSLLAAGALLVLLRTRERPVLLGWWLTALATALLFYWSDRYAVTLVPALALSIGEALRVRSKWLVLMLAPAVILALPFVRTADRMQERIAAFDAARPGRATTWEARREKYVEGQAALPDVFWPSRPNAVGVAPDELDTRVVDLARSRWGDATPLDATLLAGLRRDVLADSFEWAIDDRSIDADVVASDALVALDRRSEAVQRLERAAHRAPGRLDVLVRLIAAADVGEHTDGATWESQLFHFHDSSSAHFALCEARRRWGDPQGAVEDATWVADHWPRARLFALHQRALALLDLQRPQDAARDWVETLQLHAAMHGDQRFDDFARAMTDQSPDDERAAALALRHWRKRGVPLEAQRILQRFPALAAPK